MVKSFFVEFRDWFKTFAKTIEERVNGKKTALTYMHKEMLTEELSVDLKWDALTVNSNIVAADVVSLSSSLPLKRRDSIGSASGEVPKLGMKMQTTEKNMTDIDVLKARGVSETILVDKIFQDQVKCTMGIHEKLEFMFLQSLSSGVTVIDDDNNVGTGIRVDFGYKPSNKFGASVNWSDVANAKPIDDIKRIRKEAKAAGDNPSIIMMDESSFDNLSANDQIKQEYAFSQNFVGNQIPTPDLEQVNSMMLKRYKLTIVIVDRTVTVERDGRRTVLSPWQANTVVFLDSLRVGKLVYGILAEETRQSKAAMYEKSGSYILLKKWATEEPFAEHTSSQALAIPVIENVSSIYTLDTEGAEASQSPQLEGDDAFTYDEVEYTKASVVTGINAARSVDSSVALATEAQLDATLTKKIDSLSEEGLEIFEGELITL